MAICLRLDAIVSVAMPNCNANMSDSPVDKNHEDCEGQVASKWRAVFVAASEYVPSCDVLVVPDAGCGVFENGASVIGNVFAKLLRTEFMGTK